MPSANHDRWRTSSYTSNGANCVEVAVTPWLVGVRDTKARGDGTLEFDSGRWTDFLHALKTGHHAA